MRIYLDNAATTCMDERVISAMTEVMTGCYGNPSSIHAHGREARSIIEKARKQVAEYIHVSPAEIFFTSGGTEANNMILRRSVEDLGVTHIISSPIEHHAVTHTLEELEHAGRIRLSHVRIDDCGRVEMEHLQELLQTNDKTLVSLMHANNEIGTMIDLQQVGELCRATGALFHSDTVQTMAHFPLDIRQLNIHFLTCSAHKFHGPKGIGFLYCSSDLKIKPFITGGAQERNMRAGTENIYGIVGLSRALEIAHTEMAEHQNHIRGLKNHMVQCLRENIPGVEFNGDISDNSLYTVLSVRFPATPDAEMFLMKLDISGISASGGSACSSGSNVGSHVLAALHVPDDQPSVRFSFSRFNTIAEIDNVVEVLKGMLVRENVVS